MIVVDRGCWDIASELGAGYACDGYARVKQDLSVLVSKSIVPSPSHSQPLTSGSLS
jgi:hypothetical protein